MAVKAEYFASVDDAIRWINRNHFASKAVEILAEQHRTDLLINPKEAVDTALTSAKLYYDKLFEQAHINLQSNSLTYEAMIAKAYEIIADKNK